ncbi:MAG: transcriptional regulator/antitoxin MazE [Pseudomonadota bacterium]
MISVKIRKVGNSAGITLSPEALTLLDRKIGDEIFLVRGDDGSLRLVASDPDTAEMLEAAEQVMDENHDLLQRLA